MLISGPVPEMLQPASSGTRFSFWSPCEQKSFKFAFSPLGIQTSVICSFAVSFRVGCRSHGLWPVLVLVLLLLLLLHQLCCGC
jgi:hypothetical protein